MPLLLLLLFVAVPLAEIAILVKVGQLIGLLWTILIVILTAVIGTTLLRIQGFGVLSRAAEALSDGRMPVEPVIEGVCLLVAGAFLLTPGLLTDTVGFLLLVPPIRIAVARWTLNRLLKSGAARVSVFRSSRRPKEPPDGRHADDFSASPKGPVIDGEYRRIDETTGRPPRDGKSGS